VSTPKSSDVPEHHRRAAERVKAVFTSVPLNECEQLPDPTFETGGGRTVSTTQHIRPLRLSVSEREHRALCERDEALEDAARLTKLLDVAQAERDTWKARAESAEALLGEFVAGFNGEMSDEECAIWDRARDLVNKLKG
jgi:hypothetical protein